MKLYQNKKEELDKLSAEEEKRKLILSDLLKKTREEEDLYKKLKKELLFNQNHLKSSQILFEKLKTSVI